VFYCNICALKKYLHNIVYTSRQSDNLFLFFIGSCFIKRLIRFLSRSNYCLLAYEKTNTDEYKIFFSFSIQLESNQTDINSLRHDKKNHFSLYIDLAFNIRYSLIIFFTNRLFTNKYIYNKMFKIFLFVFKNKKICFDGIKEQQYTYTHHDCGGVLDVKQTYIYVYI